MKKIILEARLQQNGEITISLKDPTRPASQYEPWSVNLGEINSHCNELIAILNQKSKHSNSFDEATQKVKHAGKMLCDALFTKNIKNVLLKTNADYLIIDIDDGLVQIPWELIYLNDQFLCEHFVTGRTAQVKTPIKDNYRNNQTPLNMWVIVNPQNDLPGAASEAESILKFIDKMNKSIGETVSLDRDPVQFSDMIKKHIKDYDIVHFAGHADYDMKNPSKSGWKLADDYFTASQINDIQDNHPMPSLIFSNACQSGRSQTWRCHSNQPYNEFDMAHSFITSGVRHYIGTFWNIPDIPGKEFALNFYHSLLNGHPIGKAIQIARKKMMQGQKPDICWASYVLYGDPTTRYVRGNDDIDPPINPPPPPSPPSPPRRYFNYYYLIILLILMSLYYFNKTQHNMIDKDLLLIYMKAEKEKQDTIDKLIKQINDNTSHNNPKNEKCIDQLNPILSCQNDSDKPVDSWSSKQTTLSIVTGDSFKSFVYNEGVDDFIASAIENAIQQYPGITIVDRRELSDILKELNIATGSLVKSKHRIEPDFLSANYLLNLNVRLKNDHLIVSSRIKNTQNCSLVMSFDTVLDPETNIFDQKHKFEDLVYHLIKNFPVKGKITQISEKEAHLNIGYAEGVRKKQRYQIIENNSILYIKSTENHSSIGIIQNGQTNFKTGWKVILLNDLQN